MVNIKGELIVKGGKCTTEKIRPQPRTVTVMEGSGNDDTVKRSIIRSIVRRERKSDRESSSECLDLQLSPERLML